MGKTVVIGGGVSGLAAAYTLESAGADCLVLEKNNFSGGRVRGATRDGFILDLGAQFFFTRYHSTFDLMRKLGIAEELVWFKGPVSLLRDGRLNTLYPGVRHNLRHPLDNFRFRAVSIRSIPRVVKMVLSLVNLRNKLDFDDPLKAIELDNISFADYGRRNFGEELLEYCLQPIASTLTLGEPEDISAAYGLALAWYFIPGLGTTRRGMGLLAESLSESVSGLRLDTEATRIVVEGKKVKGVEVRNGNKVEFIESDSVVCTTTASAASRLLRDLPDAMTDVLAGIRYSACAHVMLALPGKLAGDIYAIAIPRKEGLCLSGVTDDSNKVPGYAPPGAGLVHAFTFGDFARRMLEQTDGEIQDRVTRDIQTFIPGFPDKPIFCEIFRWTEALCLKSPGQIASVERLKTGLRAYDGLFLAGEYFGMPSVEAAIHSGVQAAERLLESS